MTLNRWSRSRPVGDTKSKGRPLIEFGLLTPRVFGNGGGFWQNMNIKVATNEGSRQATKFFVNDVEPVVSVETSRGYKIKGTTTHRIRIVDAKGIWQWRRFLAKYEYQSGNQRGIPPGNEIFCE